MPEYVHIVFIDKAIVKDTMVNTITLAIIIKTVASDAAKVAANMIPVWDSGIEWWDILDHIILC